MGSNCVWLKDTEGVCVGVNGCAEHTKAHNCKMGSHCQWFRGTWNDKEEFYTPTKGWKFDPGQQNFFSTGHDREMTSDMIDEMHLAWTSYCNNKIKVEWAATKYIRNFMSMANSHDTRNKQNRCIFLAEKAKKEHWNSETFCEKLASKKHGTDSGNVGNNVVRFWKWARGTEAKSKTKCMKEINEESMLIRNRDQEAASLNTGDSIPSGIQEAEEEGVAPAEVVAEEVGVVDKWPKERCEACCPEGKPGHKTWREIESTKTEGNRKFCKNGKTAEGRFNRATTMYQQAKEADCVTFCTFATA